MEETISLGGNIELIGFSNLDKGSMVIVRKVVGNYARRFSNLCEKFEKLKIAVKPVHETEKSEKYELKAEVVDNGKNVNSEETNRNLFFALDEALKKIEKQIETKKEEGSKP